MAFSRSRLTVARLRRGRTRKSLAEAVRMSEKALYGYEHGPTTPSEETVEALAHVLRFPVSFFYGPELELFSTEGASFRALSRTTAKQRERARAGGALAFELNSWIESRFSLPAVDVPDLKPEKDAEAAALALRTHWALGDSPISNMIHLLEAKGVRVYSLAEDCEEVDAFSLWRDNRPYVFLNTLKSGEHSRFDAAHELGHLVLHQHGAPSGQPAEHEANRFASAFLLPRTAAFGTISRNASLDYLMKVKRAWGLSLAALVYRLHEIGLLSDWYYRTLCIEIQRQGFRKQEPQPGLREHSQVLAKVFELLKAEKIMRHDVAAKLSWPVEELNALIFQLVLSAIPGAKKPTAPKDHNRPQLSVSSGGAS